MTQSKRAARGAESFSPFTTFIRVNDADDFTDPRSSSTALAAAIDVNDEFLERWITCHFSLSVNLHDARREIAREGSTQEIDAILADLDVVQGVLLELHEFADAQERVRTLMNSSYVVQHAVVAVYAWLSEILVALPARNVARRRPSFVDEGETPAYAMLSTLERLHPDLERLVRPDGLTDGDVIADADIAQKLSICFRQIGASIVRISGRATSFPPPALK
jgi:hypothetical protein